jgi:hypothetical protein
LKQVAEGFLGERLALVTNDESQFANRASLQRGFQHRQDRNDSRDLGLALFRLDAPDAIPNVLASVAHRIAPAQPAIQQHVEPDPFLGPERPTLVIGGNVILGPSNETVASFCEAGSQRQWSGQF